MLPVVWTQPDGRPPIRQAGSGNRSHALDGSGLIFRVVMPSVEPVWRRRRARKFSLGQASVADAMVELIEEAAIPVCMVGLLYALPNTQLTRRLAREGLSLIHI